MPQKPRHIKYWRNKGKMFRRTWRKTINLAAWRIPVLMGEFEFLETAVEVTKREYEMAVRMMEPIPMVHGMDTVDPLYMRFGLVTWKNDPVIIIPDVIMPRFELEPLKLEDIIKPL